MPHSNTRTSVNLLYSAAGLTNKGISRSLYVGYCWFLSGFFPLGGKSKSPNTESNKITNKQTNKTTGHRYILCFAMEFYQNYFLTIITKKYYAYTPINGTDVNFSCIYLHIRAIGLLVWYTTINKQTGDRQTSGVLCSQDLNLVKLDQ